MSLKKLERKKKIHEELRKIHHEAYGKRRINILKEKDMKIGFLVKIASFCEKNHKYAKADLYYNYILLKFANTNAINKLESLGVAQDVLDFISGIENPKERQIYISRVFVLSRNKSPDEIQLFEITKDPIILPKEKVDYMNNNVRDFYFKAKELIEKEYKNELQFKNWAIHILPEYISIKNIDELLIESQIENIINMFELDLSKLYAYLNDKRELDGPTTQIHGSYEEVMSAMEDFYANLEAYYPHISIYYKDEDATVFAPKEWDGWRIVRISSDNNFHTEGLKMNNCLRDGTYYNEFINNQIILFSLRDKYNYPHGCMTVDYTGNIDEPPKGRKNHILTPDLEEKFQEFISSPEYSEEIDKFYRKYDALLDVAMEMFDNYWETITIGEAREIIGTYDFNEFLHETIRKKYQIKGDAFQEIDLQILDKFLEWNIAYLVKDTSETVNNIYMDRPFDERKVLIKFITINYSFKYQTYFDIMSLSGYDTNKLREIATYIYKQKYMGKYILNQRELEDLLDSTPSAFIAKLDRIDYSFLESIFLEYKDSFREFFNEAIEKYIEDEYMLDILDTTYY